MSFLRRSTSTSAFSFVLTVLSTSAVLPAIPVSSARAQETSAATLPAPWQASDIGLGTQIGATAFASDAFTVRGGGKDIQDKADGFRFVYQPLRGDAVLTEAISNATMNLMESSILAQDERWRHA